MMGHAAAWHTRLCPEGHEFSRRRSSRDYEEVRPRDVVFEFRSATAGRDGSKNFGQPSECKIFLHPKLLQDGEQVCADH